VLSGIEISRIPRNLNMKSSQIAVVFHTLVLSIAGASSTKHLTFPEFVEHHARTYTGSEYNTRRHFFEANLDKIESHNQKPQRLWTAGVSHLADRSEQEVSALWGWNPTGRPNHHASGAQNTELMLRRVHDPSPLPKSFNWTQLSSMQNILDQGQCGSCWAVAATAVLSAHSEIYGDGRMLSAQQIVSCTPNPHSCGGHGGCDGATAELAFDYVLENGLVDDEAFPYTELEAIPTTPDCPSEMSPAKSSKIGLKDTKDFAVQKIGNNFGMTGWERLPENKLEPLMRALVERGPVAVSVAASDMWSFYEHGIMDDCVKDAVVNHAVTLIGYGSLGDDGYWLIQNSWGGNWGEAGRMRVLRRDSPEETEEDFCGWDRQPEVGSGCDGGPTKMRVCGTCGMLFDTVVPHFGDQSSQKSLLSTGSLRSARKHA